MKILITILALFISFIANSQVLNLTPTSIPTGVSLTGVTKTNTEFTLAGTGPLDGIYISNTVDLSKGFTVEMKILITSPEDRAGNLFLAKTASLGTSYNSTSKIAKIKQDWIGGSASDQLWGEQTLPIGKWTIIKYGLDSIGKIYTSIDGYLDINGGRIYKSIINGPTSYKLQICRGLKGKLAYFKLYLGKPTLKQFGIENYLYNRETYLDLELKYIDYSLRNQDIKISQTNPLGAVTELGTFRIPNKEETHIKLPFPSLKDDIIGVYTYKLIGKTWEAKNYFTKTSSSPIFPTGIPIVLYNVRKEEFQTVKNLGVTHINSDWVINNVEKDWTKYKEYLNEAKKVGLKLVVTGNLYFKSGTLAYDTSSAFQGLYIGDEIFGEEDRILSSDLSLNLLKPKIFTIGDLNNYTSRINKVAQASDVVALNIYYKDTLNLLCDAIAYTSKLTKCWFTLPQYNNVQPSEEEMLTMTSLAFINGATGLQLFEWEHGDWKTSGVFIDRLRAVISWVKINEQYLVLPSTVVNSSNPNVRVIKKGTRYFACNMSRVAQTATIDGIPYNFDGLGRKEF